MVEVAWVMIVDAPVSRLTLTMRMAWFGRRSLTATWFGFGQPMTLTMPTRDPSLMWLAVTC